MDWMFNSEVAGINSQLHSTTVLVHYLLVSRGFKTIGRNESVFHRGPIPDYPETVKLPDMWNFSPNKVVLLYRGNGTYLLLKLTHLTQEALISLMKHKDGRSVEVVLPYESHIGANYSTYATAYVNPVTTMKVLQDNLINPFFAGQFSDTKTSHFPPTLPGSGQPRIISRHSQYNTPRPSFQPVTSSPFPSPQSPQPTTSNKSLISNFNKRSNITPSGILSRAPSAIPSHAPSAIPSRALSDIPSHAMPSHISSMPNAFGYGRSDLGPNIGHSAPGGGGMIFDPLRQASRPAPDPQHFPPGSVPPGARFDPTSPFNTTGPDPDEMPMPPFDDYNNI